MPDTKVDEPYHPPTVVAIGTLEELTRAIPKGDFKADGYKGTIRVSP